MNTLLALHLIEERPSQNRKNGNTPTFVHNTVVHQQSAAFSRPTLVCGTPLLQDIAVRIGCLTVSRNGIVLLRRNVQATCTLQILRVES